MERFFKPVHKANWFKNEVTIKVKGLTVTPGRLWNLLHASKANTILVCYFGRNRAMVKLPKKYNQQRCWQPLLSCDKKSTKVKERILKNIKPPKPPVTIAFRTDPASILRSPTELWSSSYEYTENSATGDGTATTATRNFWDSGTGGDLE